LTVLCRVYFCDVQDENFRKVFVGGLHYNTNEDSLKAYYQQWGDVSGAIIMRDQNTQRYFSHTFQIERRVNCLYMLLTCTCSFLPHRCMTLHAYYTISSYLYQVTH